MLEETTIYKQQRNENGLNMENDNLLSNDKKGETTTIRDDDKSGNDNQTQMCSDMIKTHTTTNKKRHNSEY